MVVGITVSKYMICKLILIFLHPRHVLGINIEYAHKICVKYQETFEAKKAVHFWKKKKFFFFSSPIGSFIPWCRIYCWIGT